MMRRMSVLHQNLGGIGESIPSALRFPKTSLVLVEHGYNPVQLLAKPEYVIKVLIAN